MHDQGVQNLGQQKRFFEINNFNRRVKFIIYMTSFQDKKATLFRLKWVEWIFVNLPFVCYLALLGVIYISNAHASEKAVRKIEVLKQEVKDTKWRAMNLKQEVMHGSIQSQIERKVEGSGLLPSKEPPYKIIAEKTVK